MVWMDGIAPEMMLDFDIPTMPAEKALLWLVGGLVAVYVVFWELGAKTFPIRRKQTVSNVWSCLVCMLSTICYAAIGFSPLCFYTHARRLPANFPLSTGKCGVCMRRKTRRRSSEKALSLVASSNFDL